VAASTTHSLLTGPSAKDATYGFPTVTPVIQQAHAPLVRRATLFQETLVFVIQVVASISTQLDSVTTALQTVLLVTATVTGITSRQAIAVGASQLSPRQTTNFRFTMHPVAMVGVGIQSAPATSTLLTWLLANTLNTITTSQIIHT